MDSHASGQSWMMQILTSVVPYHADAKASLQTRRVSKSSFLGGSEVCFAESVVESLGPMLLNSRVVSVSQLS